MVDFRLFQSLSNVLRESNKLTLDELKLKTEQYRKLHNQLTQEIWRLNAEYNRTSNSQKRDEITGKKDKITKQLKELGSEKLLNALLDEIKNKEINEDGYSELDRNSPYILCKV